MEEVKNKMACTAKDPCPPRCFLHLTEAKSWRCGGEEEEEENVYLLTHDTWVKIQQQQNTGPHDSRTRMPAAPAVLVYVCFCLFIYFPTCS